MLMRAQEIQVHHGGMSEICEYDDLETEMTFNPEGQLSYRSMHKSSNDRQAFSMLTSDYASAMPELSLNKC